jgi:predicted peroxiredoxin
VAQQEHALMAALFAQQMHLSLTLFEMLKSNDLVTDDDFEAFHHTALPRNVAEIMIREYMDAAQSLGLKVELP